MNFKYRKPTVALLIAFSLTLPVSSQSLSALLETAQKNSDAVSTLEVSKQQSLLSIEINDLDRQTSYTFNPSVSTAYSNLTNTNTYKL